MRQRSLGIIFKIREHQQVLRAIQSRAFASSEQYESGGSSIWWAQVVALALLILLLSAQNSSAQAPKTTQPFNALDYAHKACEAMRKTKESLSVEKRSNKESLPNHSESRDAISKMALSCSNTLDGCLVSTPGDSKAEYDAFLGWCDQAQMIIGENKACENFLSLKIKQHGNDRNDAGYQFSDNFAPRCFMKSWQRKLLEPVPEGPSKEGNFFQRLFQRPTQTNRNESRS